MHGRDLLREGLVWRIGNGEGIDIWKDNWIPRAGLKRPLGQKPGEEVSTVSDLLLPDGQGWNEALLNDVFFDGDVADIVKTPVGRAGSEDYIAWNYTKNGIFTVKSAYHLRMQLKDRETNQVGCSNSCEEHRGWLALWGADVPGKARIHVWRLAKNGLAVGQELQRRHIKAGVKCIVCHREESLLHRFWRCPHSARIWELVRDLSGFSLHGPCSDVQRPRELQSWLLDWLGKLPDKEVAVAIMTLYQMWLARNDAREQASIEDPGMIARRTLKLVEEWHGLNNSSATVAPRNGEHWLPPEEGWLKVNADGAFHASSGVGGCGAVLRNHHGDFVAGTSHFLPRALDPEQAELQACKCALTLAKEHNIDRVHLESDCLGVVAKLRSSDFDRSVHGQLIQEVKSLLWSFAEHRIRHVRRSCNGVAHSLAKYGCVNNVCMVWVGTPPDLIVNLVASEHAGLS
jgi:ribonuclease HI